MSSRGLSWVDGQLSQQVSLSDRGLLYGDGVFRTMLVSDGRVVDETGQLKHLLADLGILGLPPPKLALLQNEAQRAARQIDAGILRLSLTAGDSARGYARDVVPVRRIMQGSRLPDWPIESWTQGIRLGLSEYRLGEQPVLAGAKHLNRLDQVMARRSLPADCSEALVCDQAGHVVSGIMSNVFWWAADGWHTPPIIGCGVAGRMRARIIAALQAQGQIVQFSQRTPGDLRGEAEALLLCNSLIACWPVRLWQGREYHRALKDLPGLRSAWQMLAHPMLTRNFKHDA